MATRYVHTNIVARDWQRLVEFYVAVFDCVPTGPERDQSGPWLSAISGIEGAHLRGRHLRLPGHGPDGPTLEIYSYDELVGAGETVANQIGFGHIAFHVDDVTTTFAAMLAHGGSAIGEVTTTVVDGVGELEIVYARDPEGNIVELQHWSS